MACEMFWMVAEEEPAPAPKHRARKAKGEPDSGFACDAPDAGKKRPTPRAIRSKKRNARAESERRP